MSENKAGGSAADANSLCYLTASEAIKRFKTRDLSPVLGYFADRGTD